MNNWIKTSDLLPKEGEIVYTKIEDEKGCRNEGKLKLLGKLWFTADGKMYVYYTPTHWKSLEC